MSLWECSLTCAGFVCVCVYLCMSLWECSLVCWFCGVCVCVSLWECSLMCAGFVCVCVCVNEQKCSFVYMYEVFMHM